MKAKYFGQFIIKAIFLGWAILWIVLFIRFPGRVSYVQWSDLEKWPHLAEKLERLNPASDLFNFLWSFIGVMSFSLAFTSLGSFIVKTSSIGNRLLKPSTTITELTLLATNFLIGHGVFSLIFLALSGIYQLTSTHVVLLLLIGALSGFNQTMKAVQGIFTDWSTKLREITEDRWIKAIIFLSIIILFTSLLYSTARISYDSSAVYFSDAKITAMTHHIQFFTNDSFVTSVFQTAIQYTALIQVFGDQSARMFSWICGVATIIFSLALGERVGLSKLANIVLLTLLLTSTAFLDLMGDGKVDLISCAPAIAAVYWIVVESQRKTFTIPLLLLIGFLIGLAIVSRPFNAFTLSIFTILFYFQRSVIKNGFEPLNYKLFINSLFYISIGAVGLGIYHLLANWIILGNPLAFWGSYSKINPSIGPWDYNPNQILTARLLYPFIVTLTNTPQSLGNISPMFIGFLPALFVEDFRKTTKFSGQSLILLTVSIFTLLVWIFSFFTIYEIRYVFFLWIILFIPTAEIIAATLENKELFFRNTLMILIILLLAFNILRTTYISLDTYSPINEQGNPQCFCQPLNSINETASLGDRVLTLGAFRYYLRSDLFACSTKHDEYQKLQIAAQKGDESFWLEVYKQGYTYIAYENDYTTRHLQMGIIPSPENTPDWLELKSLYSSPDGTHIAYRINIKKPPSNKGETCKMNPDKIWEVQPAE